MTEETDGLDLELALAEDDLGGWETMGELQTEIARLRARVAELEDEGAQRVRAEAGLSAPHATSEQGAGDLAFAEILKRTGSRELAAAAMLDARANFVRQTMPGAASAPADAERLEAAARADAERARVDPRHAAAREIERRLRGGD